MGKSISLVGEKATTRGVSQLPRVIQKSLAKSEQNIVLKTENKCSKILQNVKTMFQIITKYVFQHATIRV